MTTPTTPKPSVFRNCKQCGKAFFAARKDAQFCSDACKQKAYRIKHRGDPRVNIREGRKKAIITMQSQNIKYTCPVCGETYFRGGLEMNRMYCSNACKQRAYRERQADHTEKIAALANQYKALGTLRKAFHQAGIDYLQRYRSFWRFQGGYITQQEGSWYITREGETLAYLQSRARACRFFAEYVVTGKPNFALLRQR